MTLDFLMRPCAISSVNSSCDTWVNFALSVYAQKLIFIFGFGQVFRTPVRCGDGLAIIFFVCIALLCSELLVA